MYVYKFLDKNNEIIYIGRSKNLDKRILSHTHLPENCYKATSSIEYIELKSNDESAIYERYLINKYMPMYNIQHKNNSEFSFELPDKEWKLYVDKIGDVNKYKDYISISYQIPSNITDADLGKFLKLLTKTNNKLNILFSKKSVNSNPLTKMDISKILEISIKPTERFLKRLIDLQILFKVIYKNKEAYAVNEEYIYSEKYIINEKGE